jgi:glycerol-3-phosphate acyltransferase PlsY
MISVLLLVLCYFIGSIPFSYIIVKIFKGVDLRTVGSKNVGATNAGRVLGKWGFISSFLLDMLKSYVPLLILKQSYSTDFLLLCALFLILGHTYTIFLNFKGGKGVATGLGVFLALSPKSVVFALLVFVVAVGIFKLVSLGSVLAAITLLITVLFTEKNSNFIIFTFFVALFVIYKHKDNIKRIINGTEKKIGEKVD